MKRSLLFLFAFMLTVWANAQISSLWYSEIVPGVEYYLYNVETNSFLTGANDWGTRASVTTTAPGHKVRIESRGDGTYRLKDSSTGKYLDCDNSRNAWVDGGNRANFNDSWTFVLDPNTTTYTIYNGWMRNYSWGVIPGLSDNRIYFDNKATATRWAFITPENYLKSKTIPFDCMLIGDSAFQGCSALKKVAIPSVTLVSSNAFNGCTSLTNVDIQGNATIASQAFNGCTSLTIVDIKGNATLASSAFCNCNSLSAFWAKNLSSYGTKVFYNCENLAYIGVGTYYKDLNGPNYLVKDGTLMEATVNTVIGSDIKTIGDYAFAGRGIKKINIPAAVTKIDSYAFENCTALEEVQVNWDMPLSVPATTFEGVDCSNVTLYCPEDAEDFYSMVDVWSDFFTKAGEMDNERQYYAEVGKAGYATTYFPASVVVPEDVTAYYISAVSENGTSLVMHELETIPANTGVLLHASAGMHTFNAAANEADALADNKLVKVAAGVNVPASDATNANYVLQKQDQVAFYKVTEPKETSKPSAYLQLPANSTNVKMFTLDTDVVTAIQALTTGKSTEIYDLSGRKLSKLQKGINIVNGVKILVK